LFSRLGLKPQAGEQFQAVKLSLTAMAEARDYVNFIENQIGASVSMIGTGPNDKDMIIR